MSTWHKKEFGRVALHFLNGGTPETKVPEYWDGDIPWITGADVTDQEVKLGRRYITKTGLDNSASNLARKGSVLLVTRTGVGKAAVAPCDVAISQDLTAVILPEHVYPRFAFYWWLSLSADLKAKSQGAIIKGLTRRDVERLPFPEINPHEQERIVEILDQADSLRRQRAAANTQAARLLPALFRKLFGDLSMNLKGYPSTNLESLIESTRNGLYKHESFYGRGTRILKMYNILDGWWNLKRMDFVEADEGEVSDYAVRSGDILLNRVNTPELVGKCAVVPAELDGAVFESKNIRIRMLPTKAEPEFIWFYLNSPYGHAMLTRGMKHAIGMATVNNTDLRNTPIPLPPMAEQKVWSTHIKNIRLFMDKAEQSTTQLETLFQVLLQRAFDGRLTSKWREAHANELLREMELQTRG